jgi:hypothetical protein
VLKEKNFFFYFFQLGIQFMLIIYIRFISYFHIYMQKDRLIYLISTDIFWYTLYQKASTEIN